MIGGNINTCINAYMYIHTLMNASIINKRIWNLKQFLRGLNIDRKTIEKYHKIISILNTRFYAGKTQLWVKILFLRKYIILYFKKEGRCGWGILRKGFLLISRKSWTHGVRAILMRSRDSSPPHHTHTRIINSRLDRQKLFIRFRHLVQCVKSWNMQWN